MNQQAEVLGDANALAFPDGGNKLAAIMGEISQALEGVVPGRIYGDAHSRSPQFDAFIKSFIVVQKRLGKASKAAYNSHLNNRYVDLPAVWDVVHEAIGDEPFAIFQNAVTNLESKAVSVETILMHESCQWMSNTMTAVPAHLGPQAIGVVVTYLRRYGLCSMFGIVADADTDGNPPPQNRAQNQRQGTGSGAQGRREQENRATTTPAAKATPSTAGDKPAKPVENTAGNGKSDKPPFKCSKERQDALLELNRRAEAVSVTPDDLLGVVCQQLSISGTPNLRNFSDSTMDKALKAIKEHVEEAEEQAAMRDEANGAYTIKDNGKPKGFTNEPVPAAARPVGAGGRSK